MKWLSDKMKIYGLMGLLLVALLGSNGWWISKNAKVKNDLEHARKTERAVKLNADVLAMHLDSLKLKNAKLNLTILLNNCNSYKIHEKVNAIPNDSLLYYADSLLTRPIPKAGKKGRSIRAATTKLSRIPRALLGCKGEDCSQ